MTNIGIHLRPTMLVTGILALLTGRLHGESPGESPVGGETLVFRLVHPERQAAEVLSLFEGARAPHPAAALAAWKRAARDQAQLGKSQEAAITLFNPEMVREWRVMHGAELHVDLGTTDGKPRWYAIVPQDDGAVAAAVTAGRLTDGGDEAPLREEGNGIPVERLGPRGAMFASRLGDSLILGSSREELRLGLRRMRAVTGQNGTGVARPAERESAQGPRAFGVGGRLDSGVVFEFDPARLAGTGSGSLTQRRAGLLLRGLACRRVQGILNLKGECLALEVTTLLDHEDRAQPTGAKVAASVEPAWLEWVPRAGVMAVVSLAFEPSAAFWDWAFSLADRVERTDAARAELAPLRARINLLAGTAGVRPEVDLWPRLRGVTACIFGDSADPGRPTGALLVMHVDTEAAAARLSKEVLPRLGALFTGKKPGERHSRAAVAGPDAAGAAALKARTPEAAPVDARTRGADREPEASRRVASVSGRDLIVWRRERDVLVAWGDDALAAARSTAANPDRSVAALCTGWAREGKPAPQRVGACWPARCWSPARGTSRVTPAWRVLMEGPPAVWWGWTEPATASDSIQYAGLRERVHRFLDQLPLDPSPIR